MRYLKSLLFGCVIVAGTVGCDTQAAVDAKALQEAKTNGFNEAKQQNDAAKAEGYKQGQIDALTGKIKFRLTEATDRTLTWQPIQFSAATQPSVRNRTAVDVPYLVPLNDGHGGYVYVPMQELTEKVEK